MPLRIQPAVLWRPLVFLVLAGLLGLAGLVAVDTGRRPAAVSAAIARGFEEGRLGDAWGFDHIWGRELNHFSECIGLSTILDEEALPPLWFSLSSPALQWAPPAPMCRTLRDAVEGHPSSRYYAYSRYWHGYRLVTEPVLSYFSYASLQALCAGLMALSGLALMFAAARIVGLAAAVAAALALGLGTETAWLWLTPTHAISFAVLMLGGALVLRQAAGGARPEILAGTAFLAGGVYNFFDFLYNPDILMFLAGWACLIAAEVGKPPLRRLVSALAVEGAVVAGYVAMWSLKWALVLGASRIYGPLQWFPTGDINRWLAGGEYGYMPLAATATLLAHAASTVPGAILLAGCAIGVTSAAWSGARSGKGGALLALAALWLAPLVVLEAKAGHTIMHAAFVGRFIPWAATLTLAAAVFIVRREPALRPRSAEP